MGADPNLRLQDPPSKVFLGFFEGDAKTNYYLKRDRNLTYLMLAALTEQQSPVSDLISHGAERNAYSARYRRYAVAFAAERNNVPIMQMILGREANDKSRTVTVSLKKQRATLYKNGEAVSTSRVSTGKRGSRTPKGTFVITSKHRHHNSSIYGSAMPYFMRLSCGDFGLHYSPSVPSYPASHGCVRMPWSNVKHFYSVLRAGDIVTIE
jgi:lipoprotein-anchoring transpeptidase ErfK/SrfK